MKNINVWMFYWPTSMYAHKNTTEATTCFPKHKEHLLDMYKIAI